MVLPVVKAAAVPDNVPVIVVAAKLVKPVTDVTVPPKVIVVEPKIVELFANCAFVIPAVALKLEVDNPVAEIVPEAIEIPDPAVNGVW